MKYPDLYGDVKNMLEKNIFISAFNKKIFELYKKAVEANSDFDTVMLTKDLSAEETGRIIKMTVLENIPVNNIKNELENFIGALKKQNEIYQKKNIDLKEISASGDDWVNYIKSKDKSDKSREKFKKEDN